MQDVEITLNAAGHGSVVIDGKDVSDSVYALSFRARVGQPSRVVLLCYPKSLTVRAAADEVHRRVEVAETTTINKTARTYQPARG